MRVAAACALAALTVALAGCAGDRPDEARSPQECTPQIRMGSVVYSGYAYTDRHATEFATAEEADCHDMGPSAQGSVFPDHPRQVVVWSFRGYAPEKVLGVRFDKDSFAVFVAESVPRLDIDRITGELSQTRR